MKMYLDVHFTQNKQVKSLGAKWDPDHKKWYVPDGVDNTLFIRWQQKKPKSQMVGMEDVVRLNYGSGEELMKLKPNLYPSNDKHSAYKAERDFIAESLYNDRFWLAVPFSDIAEAKRMGFRWDPERKQWWGTESHVTGYNKGSPEDALIEKWLNPG